MPAPKRSVNRSIKEDSVTDDEDTLTLSDRFPLSEKGVNILKTHTENGKKNQFNNLLNNLEDCITSRIKIPVIRKLAKPNRQKENASSYTDKLYSPLKYSYEQNKQLMEPYNSTPFYIKGGTMRDYQIHGLNWMISIHESRLNGILGDEMGLGKTLQTISLLGYMKNCKKLAGRYLVLAPLSTLSNWMDELAKWCPSIKAICLTGDKNEREAFIRHVLKVSEWDVCVTSYQLCIIEKATLKKFNWEYMVIDEGHRIKNELSLLAKVVREFTTSSRLILTGTPIHNNLHELWALYNFLLPEIFNSGEDFDKCFDVDQALDDKAAIKRLHYILEPLLLRRLKSDVEKSLKPRKEIMIHVSVTSMQREWNKKVLQKYIDIINGQGVMVKKSLANTVMQLRKCSNHPYLFPGAEPGPPYNNGDHLVYNCGKMIMLDKLLHKLQEQGSRILLFSQFTRMLDIIEDYCDLRQFNYCRLDGAIGHEERKEQIEDFNKQNSDKFIFLLSTRAGGLGINLHTADVVIIYDSDWNPQMDLQAISRAHRIGQTKQVRVYKFISNNTIDEAIMKKQEKKLTLGALVVNQFDNEELLNILRYNVEHMFETSDCNFADVDITDLVKQEDENEEVRHKKKKLKR